MDDPCAHDAQQSILILGHRRLRLATPPPRFHGRFSPSLPLRRLKQVKVNHCSPVRKLTTQLLSTYNAINQLFHQRKKSG